MASQYIQNLTIGDLISDETTLLNVANNNSLANVLVWDTGVSNQVFFRAASTIGGSDFDQQLNQDSNVIFNTVTASNITTLTNAIDPSPNALMFNVTTATTSATPTNICTITTASPSSYICEFSIIARQTSTLPTNPAAIKALFIVTNSGLPVLTTTLENLNYPGVALSWQVVMTASTWSLQIITSSSPTTFSIQASVIIC